MGSRLPGMLMGRKADRPRAFVLEPDSVGFLSVVYSSNICT